MVYSVAEPEILAGGGRWREGRHNREIEKNVAAGNTTEPSPQSEEGQLTVSYGFSIIQVGIVVQLFS